MGNGDHIVIPKSILKRFIGKNNKITSINLKNGEIKKFFPDSIFTEENYYMDDIDKYIKDKSETIIGNLYYSIKERQEEIKTSNILNMKNVFILQNYRNRSFIKKLGSRFPTLEKYYHNRALRELIDFYLKTDGKIEECIDDELKNIFNYIEDMYNKFTPGFLIIENKKHTLILPSSQFCFIRVSGNDTYIYPIAPDAALIWIKYPKKEEVECVTINEEDAVIKLNSLIIESELKDNTDDLVFGLESEIKEIENLINKNKDSNS